MIALRYIIYGNPHKNNRLHIIYHSNAMNSFFLAQVLFVLSTIGSSNGYLRTSKNFKSLLDIKRGKIANNMEQYAETSFRLMNLGISTKIFNSAIRGKKHDHLEWSSPFPESKKKASRKIRSFSSKTTNQELYIELMRDENVDIVIAVGPAGTGKTMLACYAAVEALRIGKIHKIVITRPVVSVDEELGYLPGGITSKMDPWTRPVFDALRETYSPKEIENMMEDGAIEIVPLGFMRGRTFKNAWIIADEMQNSTPTQMLMLATRIGEGSKMVITGDLHQSDLGAKNGLQDIYGKMRSVENSADHIRLIVLESGDVQRSRAAKSVLRLFSKNEVVASDPEPPEFATRSPDSFGVTIVPGIPQTASDRGVTSTTLDDLLTYEDKSSTACAFNNNVDALRHHSAPYAPTIASEELAKHSGLAPTPALLPQEQQSGLAPCDVEWIDLDNDAALIPLKYMNKNDRERLKRSK